MHALSAASVVLVFIGGFRFTRAEDAGTTPKRGDAAPPANVKAPGKLTLHAVNAETNQPTVYPELIISGRVTDAETGRPLSAFRLIPGKRDEGRNQTDWAENEAKQIIGSRYSTQFGEPSKAFFVRIEAPGYQSAESRAFRPMEMSATYDFALKRVEEQFAGVVQLADGKPAAGVDVVLHAGGLATLIQAGRFNRRADVRSMTTGPDGRFTFKSHRKKFVVIAVGDAGYAETSPGEFASPGKLVLQPWGKIEGKFLVGSQPAPRQQFDFIPMDLEGSGRIGAFSYGYSAVTDERGRLAFDRVVTGRGSAWCTVVVAGDSLASSRHWWRDELEIKPNETTLVQVGGTGRPVIGRVVVDGASETPRDWTRNQLVQIRSSFGERKPRLDTGWFESHIDKDGRFRFEDVPPVKYLLEVSAIPNSPLLQRLLRPEADNRWLSKKFTVLAAQAGRRDDPLDLGTITGELFETLTIGKQAPDFTVSRIAGQVRGDQIRLSDYKGELVLLDFWNASPAPFGTAPPAIKDIHNTFASDPRFHLISIYCGENADMAKRFIQIYRLNWTHGFGGDLVGGANAGKVYKVRAIPATFLIASDGRILAKYLRGAELKEAIRMALSDVKRARKTPPDASRKP